jgi:RimJ/RimL family protein N-acetyltransferase
MLSADVALSWLDDLQAGRSFALGACERRSHSPVGVARFVQTAPESAELAIVVVDEWQGLGVGRELLGTLVGHAAAGGISVVTASVLLENHRALALMRGLGGERIGRVSGMIELAARLVNKPGPLATAPKTVVLPEGPAGLVLAP